MSQTTLEQRVTRLERLVERLMSRASDNGEPARDDWMSTIGMFDGDPVMAEITEAGRQIREEDRRKARQ